MHIGSRKGRADAVSGREGEEVGVWYPLEAGDDSLHILQGREYEVRTCYSSVRVLSICTPYLYPVPRYLTRCIKLTSHPSECVQFHTPLYNNRHINQ